MNFYKLLKKMFFLIFFTVNGSFASENSKSLNNLDNTREVKNILKYFEEWENIITEEDFSHEKTRHTDQVDLIEDMDLENLPHVENEGDF